MKREMPKETSQETSEQEILELYTSKEIEMYLRHFYASVTKYAQEVDTLKPMTDKEFLPMMPRIQRIQQWVQSNYATMGKRLNLIEYVTKKNPEQEDKQTKTTTKLQKTKYKLAWLQALMAQYDLLTHNDISSDTLSNLADLFRVILDNRKFNF